MFPTAEAKPQLQGPCWLEPPRTVWAEYPFAHTCSWRNRANLLDCQRRMYQVSRPYHFRIYTCKSPRRESWHWLYVAIPTDSGSWAWMLEVDLDHGQRELGVLMPRSHQTFCSVLAVKLLGIMLRNRWWPTTFITITAGDADGWCRNCPVRSAPQWSSSLQISTAYGYLIIYDSPAPLTQISSHMHGSPSGHPQAR